MIQLVTADFFDWATEQPDGICDLVFGSPPYEDARTYGIDWGLTGEDWVAWMLRVVQESLRICNGLVAFVVEGKTRQFRWSGTPVLLMADLHRAGVHLRKPPVFQRHGIPGSGGPDWLRNDYEFIVCCTNGGKLPWADPKACGWPCKYKRGGAMSYRTADGTLRNAKTGKRLIGNNGRPDITNPGNAFQGSVGKGHMGHELAHENEAPFPEWLAEKFVKMFCPPGGLVVDPFSGSGTTMSVCKKYGRWGIGIDIRDTQTKIAERRLMDME